MHLRGNNGLALKPINFIVGKEVSAMQSTNTFFQFNNSVFAKVGGVILQINNHFFLSISFGWSVGLVPSLLHPWKPIYCNFFQLITRHASLCFSLLPRLSFTKITLTRIPFSRHATRWSGTLRTSPNCPPYRSCQQTWKRPGTYSQHPQL